MAVRLHTYFRSSCSYRVRIALHHKNIPFTSVPVNLLKGEQREPAYAKLNSIKMVPTLEIDNSVLTQSVAIIEYLEETRPECSLLPVDPKQRVDCRRFAYIFAMDTQPVQNLPLLKHVEQLGANKVEWAKHYINRGLSAAEALVDDGAQFCVGDSLTLADCCFMPQIYNAERFGVDMSPYPRLSKIIAHLNTVDAIKKAHPHAQEDCPEDLRAQ
eukprot:GEMP01064745.1.p1 GENE.GEMP01064745.1~~GEMP01064745.1.p1  ORF type:complete len:237 (+),score=35.88 GEMP01064745.1:70-711(+)